jgi:uncharacterized RDD family membrane protein YckC
MADNVLFCSQCGAQSSGGAGFCQKCGARLGSPATMSVAPPPGGSYPAAAAPRYPPIAGPGYTPVPVLSESCYGGFWIRVAAYLIDHLCVGIVLTPIALVMVFPAIMKIVQEAQQNREPGPEVIAAMFGALGFYFIVAIVGQWLYEALLTSSAWQGTIGKRVLRLKVTDDFGNRISFARATGRFFAKILSGMAMYIGFIMVAFMERKRGLHDVICGTQVLRY